MAQKKLRITQKDFLKANRRASRLEKKYMTVNKRKELPSIAMTALIVWKYKEKLEEEANLMKK